MELDIVLRKISQTRQIFHFFLICGIKKNNMNVEGGLLGTKKGISGVRG
jgi:hypothetical protein